MPLEIIRNDITKVSADAIVNTANPYVAIGSGVDSAIYKAAGRDQLLTARAKIGPIAAGEAAVTPAFGLKAKYIIHTVGPAWEGGGKGEVETVARCYRNSLSKAKELGCESVAFPLLSSGNYGFPKDVALKTAVSEISGFLFSNEMTVYLVVYDKQSFEVSGKAFSGIKSFIEEKDVVQRTGRSEESVLRRFAAGEAHHKANTAMRSPMQAYGIFADTAKESAKSISIDEMLKDKDETFQQHLFRIIDRKGLDDPDVYKKANIDRKHFSKIRSNVNYNPSKKTALALAVALELNLDETKDLLMKAGLALTRSSTFDLIMEYCIEHKVRDINEINCILFEYDQPTLGV